MVAFFVTFRLIARNFGPEGVGEYSLVRRVIAFFNPLLLLGFDIFDIIVANGFNPARVGNNPRMLSREDLRGILEQIS